MVGKKVFVCLAFLLCWSLGLEARGTQGPSWNQARLMFEALSVPPQSPLARQFQTDRHQVRNHPQKLAHYLEYFRDLERLESHARVLSWILTRSNAPAEVLALAQKNLTLTRDWQRKGRQHENIHVGVGAMFRNWDREIMPRLQRDHRDFFKADERALTPRLEASLKPILRKKEELKLRSLPSRYWGYRPLAMIDSLVIHHTVYTDIASIYDLHTSPGHFGGESAPFIAYHFLIDAQGRIFWLNDLTAKVWHARGANAGAIGIAVLGDLSKNQMPRAQFTALENLTRVLVDAFQIDAKKNIHAHGDLIAEGNDTLCPGALGRQALRQLKYRFNRQP